MDKDFERGDVEHVLALVQEQMEEIRVAQQQRAALTAKVTTAGGAVEVTVDADRMVTEITIDESYLDDFELVDLGGQITSAARSAALDVKQQSEALLAPLSERRSELLSYSKSVGAVPSLAELMSSLDASVAETADRGPDEDGDDDGAAVSRYPTVRT